MFPAVWDWGQLLLPKPVSNMTQNSSTRSSSLGAIFVRGFPADRVLAFLGPCCVCARGAGGQHHVLLNETNVAVRVGAGLLPDPDAGRELPSLLRASQLLAHCRGGGGGCSQVSEAVMRDGDRESLDSMAALSRGTGSSLDSLARRG